MPIWIKLEREVPNVEMNEGGENWVRILEEVGIVWAPPTAAWDTV